VLRLYRRAPSDFCTWRRFDDSEHWVVHSPASGQTHLLTAAAHRLWELVPECGGRDTSELIDQLQSELGLADSALAKTVEDTLAVMDEAGLIEPVLS
jgi:PqqD family protein of HPr-rel-A system